MTEWAGDELVVIAKGDAESHDRYDGMGYEFVDVSAGADDRFVELHPWANMDVHEIPLWKCEPATAATVGGAWEALKVIGPRENPKWDWDISPQFSPTRSRDMGYDWPDMTTLHPPMVRKPDPLKGEILYGFFDGWAGQKMPKLMDIVEARAKVFFPAYRYYLWSSPQCVQLLEELRWRSRERPIVLIDDTTNIVWQDGSEHVSHAQIVRQLVMGLWPYPTAELNSCYDFERVRYPRYVMESYPPTRGLHVGGSYC